MNPPKHVAIIMDGNGRWGIRKKKSRKEGRREREGWKPQESQLQHGSNRPWTVAHYEKISCQKGMFWFLRLRCIL